MSAFCCRQFSYPPTPSHIDQWMAIAVDTRSSLVLFYVCPLALPRLCLSFIGVIEGVQKRGEGGAQKEGQNERFCPSEGVHQLGEGVTQKERRPD